jgi:hypothetical protein
MHPAPSPEAHQSKIYCLSAHARPSYGQDSPEQAKFLCENKNLRYHLWKSFIVNHDSPISLPEGIAIRTEARAAEVAWFSALCADDYEFLGVPDGRLRSSYEHCGEIVRRADQLGYQNILLPSGWIAGQDALGFAFAMAPQTSRINQLVALRMG